MWARYIERLQDPKQQDALTRFLTIGDQTTRAEKVRAIIALAVMFAVTWLAAHLLTD
jgi:hypothetical protein